MAPFVEELLAAHSRFSHVGIWRLLVTAVVSRLDRDLEGRATHSGQEIYDTVMEKFPLERRD